MAESDGDSVGTGGPASGAGLVGGILSGVQGLYQPFINYNWASNAGNQAFDLQRWWSVNAPSLAVKGLMKAGLNPILALTKGMGSGGASTPVPYASFDGDSDVIGRAVSSAKGVSSLSSQLSILRDQAEIAGYQKEQERSNVFRSFAETATAEANAKIAEANRDISNATKDAAITSAKAGAVQDVTLSESMINQLTLQRAQLSSAKQLAEFDASPEGQLLLKAQRVISPAAGLVPVVRELRR